MEILAIIIGVLFFVVAWKWPLPALWLTLFSVPFYVVRFEVFGIPTTLLEIFIYSSFLAWAVSNRRQLWVSLDDSFRPIAGPLLFLVVGAALSLAVSDDLRASLGILKGWFVDPLLLYLLVVRLVEAKKIFYFITAPLLSSILLSGLAIWQGVTHQFITVDGRASAWFVSANYLSLYLVPVLILGLIIIIQGGVRYRLPVYAAWGLGLVAIYLSFSYGGWLALLLSVGAAAFIYKRFLWKLWLGLIAAPVLIFLSQLGSERFVRMLDLAERSSVSVRLQVWQTALLMIKENWLTGIGLGQFPSKYLSYADRLFFPPFETAMLHSHNLYLQFWLETGILGVVAFVWLVVYCVRQLIPVFYGVAIPLSLALGAMLVHGLIDVSYWKNDLSVLFWLILALAVIWRRHSSQTSYE